VPPVAEAGALPAGQWAVGDAVFCPARGLGEIVGRGFSAPLGTPREYLTITVQSSGMTLMVAVDHAEATGLRRPATVDLLTRALDVLSDPVVLVENESWQRRTKANHVKLSAGTLIEAAEVVRDLSWRAARRPLGMQERAQLIVGRRRLEEQLVPAFDVSPSGAGAMVSRLLPEPSSAFA
jgi:RNA polymerase-interacting CarD/CdnL/TRCF family regulator